MDLEQGSIKNNINTLENDVLRSKPVTYIYYNLLDKWVYVGETNNFFSRHNQHLIESNPKYDYKNYAYCLVIFSRNFHKSAIQDLEYLILNYLLAESNDTKFKLANKNGGFSKLNYSGKEKIFTQIFPQLWKTELKNQGLVLNGQINEIRQKQLFKYSPFIELSERQNEILEGIMSSHDNKYLVEAPAGSGKSVLFTNLATRLADDYSNLNIGLITTGNLSKQFNNVFRAVNLNYRLTVKTASQLINDAKASGSNFDIIIVDEAHKLKKYYRKGHPNARKHLQEDDDEIRLLEELTTGLVLLYDPIQGIRPQNISASEFKQLTHGYEFYDMNQQFRIGGDTDYSGEDFLKGIMYGLDLTEDDSFDKNVFTDEYFGIVDDVVDLFDYVQINSNAYPEAINRVIAGYTRKWVSKNSNKDNKGKKYDELPYDWDFGKFSKRWNSTYEDWIVKPHSENEIGSIHAIQGYDLDYVGVIIGRDIKVQNNHLIAAPENYKDEGGKPLKEGFEIGELTNYILDIYYVLLSRGIKGCRVYFEDPNVKSFFMDRVGLS